jgi:hypothetical protein
MPCDGQMRQQLLDLLSSQVTWRPCAVQEHEAFDPAPVGWCSASARVPDTQGLTDVLQQPGCCGRAGDAMARDQRKLLSETMPSA